jgi:hypothetical protein
MISDRNVILGCVADDDSGGTDEGGMLTARNVRTVLFIDLPSEDVLRRYAKGFEAVIITTGTRSAAPRDAYRKTASTPTDTRLSIVPRSIRRKKETSALPSRPRWTR